MTKEPEENVRDGGSPLYIRKNVYLCDDCGAGWVSADIDVGVTPFMDRCPICTDGTGTSLFYNVPQKILASKPVRVEWRRPTQHEIVTASPSLKRHFEMGGLKRVVAKKQEAKK